MDNYNKEEKDEVNFFEKEYLLDSLNNSKIKETSIFSTINDLEKSLRNSKYKNNKSNVRLLSFSKDC